MLTKLKKQVQTALTSTANTFHSLGLTPNHVSILGISFSILAGVVYSQWHVNRTFLILAPVLMLVSGLFDAVDGVIARVHGKATTFGAFFDSMLDRYADAIVLCGIIVGGLTNIAWGLAALVGSMMVSYARARSEAAEVKMESVGLAERAERIVLVGLASFVSYFWIDALNWSILILAVLTNFTVLQRVNYFRKAAK
ncbi:MAG: CDP-alcohol phosphatidyltransferase family protein [Candidatus Bathyarchaeota archaeon]|nr:archaetidylinositol phosphate synthase [Candidatus Bathyarchaeum tardum]WGM89374.1 MAG: archaetidylinositol phosphate synthase [Candidatus Bathyarchaeum tardum]WNZ28351.1 MAG: CDP-alcohol phosphatidyltransferase family protein [Candidatus Bathyarchaeota archaeon]